MIKDCLEIRRLVIRRGGLVRGRWEVEVGDGVDHKP